MYRLYLQRKSPLPKMPQRYHFISTMQLLYNSKTEEWKAMPHQEHKRLYQGRAAKENRLALLGRTYTTYSCLHRHV